MELRSHYLSKREAAELAGRLRATGWGASALKDEKVRDAVEIEEGGIRLYRVGKLVAAERSGIFFPVLFEEYCRDALEALPSIIVDMGAVPHIVNGADVMRPGVREFRGEFRRGDILVVRDERHGKPLAIASALEDKDICEAMERGKIAENLHHVNDKIWKLVQNAKRILER